MNYKVEFQLGDRIFTHRYYADNLTDLENQYKKQFPTAKMISIIGG